MGTGEFEGQTHESLYAMVRSAKPGELLARADELHAAGSTIDAIGGELRQYIGRVTWTGEGATAFREWGHQFALEAMRLGAYAQTVAEAMLLAGQGLSEAQAAMPKLEECSTDPAKAAQQLADRESQQREAVWQLERLSSYYLVSGESLRAAQEPEFPPVPGTAGEPVERRTSEGVTTAAGSGNTASAHRYSQPMGQFTELGDQSVSGPDSGSPTVAVQRETTDLNSAASPTSDSRTRPTAGPSTAPQSGDSSASTTPSGGGGVPTGAPRSARPPGGTPSDASKKPAVSRSVKAPGVPGGTGTQRPGETGIIGGTPKPLNSPSSALRIPRGTVIGGEPTPPMRGPVGTGGTLGGTGSRSPTAGSTQQDRRPAAQPGGSTGTPRTSSRNRPDFTPGGTGLVRGAGHPGPVPAAAGRPSDGRCRDGDRPDYLTEDEETWAADGRKIVPPVID